MIKPNLLRLEDYVCGESIDISAIPGVGSRLPANAQRAPANNG
jgi:hypothetical protein